MENKIKNQETNKLDFLYPTQNFKIKNANLLFAKSLCLPSSYSLTQNNQKTITEILKKIEHENSSPVKR